MRRSRRAFLLTGVATGVLTAFFDHAEAFMLHRGGAATGSAPVTTFNVVNSTGSASKCRYRRGLWFAKGDLPAGSVPVITGGVSPMVQFDERKTWSDGSLQLCVLSMLDTDFSANENRLYTIASTVGTYNNTGLRTLSDVTGAHTFQVGFASTTQYNGSTTVTRGSGAFTADFNTQAGVSTRVFNYHNGPVCSSWEVWGMATDNTGGAADPHLKTIWYITAWNNPNGTLFDVEYGAVVAQDWWSVAGKFRLNYDATLLDGASTINTYSTVQHPYQAQWMTVQTGNNDNHAKRFWAATNSGSGPTLYHKFDKPYARSTNLFGALNPTFIPNSCATTSSVNAGPYTANYVPLSAENQRAFVDGTGAYQGRGLMPNTDCISWMRQSSNDYRYARTNAFAGLHIPYHYRSNDTRTISSGPQAGTDTANTVISLVMRPLSAPAYDFTAQGMPAAIDAYVGSSSAPLVNTYVAKTGGNGVWTTSTDSTHAVAYSYGMYLLEGERHFMQATLDLAMNCAHQQHGNSFGGAPVATYFGITPFQTLLSIPSTQYSGIGGARPLAFNIRNVGWGMLLCAQARVVCPDNDVQSGFIKLYQAQQGAYTVFNLTYFPSDQKLLGIYGDVPYNTTPASSSSALYMNSPLESNFQVLGHAFNALANEDANSLSAINTCLQYTPLAPWESGTQYYRSADYREITCLKTATNYDPTTNPYLSRSAMLLQSNISVASNAMTWVGVDNGPTDGDVIYFLQTNQGPNLVTIPVGFSEATPYYAVNSSGFTCQIAATLGGSPLSIVDNTAPFALTSATETGSVATYNFPTGTAPAWLVVGARIMISGFTASGYNSDIGVVITGLTASSFTATLPSSGLGASTVSGQCFVFYSIGCQPASWNVTPAQFPPYLPPSDSFPPISGAALIMAARAGANAITPTMLTSASAFLAPVDNTNWSTWNMVS